MDNKSVLEFDQLCQDYITAVYQNVTGFISYQPGEKEKNEKSKVFLTYGEILYPSVNKLIEYLDINDQDVFYDLGSGVGKVALQFLLKTPVKKAQGIEASNARHQHAEKVYKTVQTEFPELFASGRELKSSQDNFLEADISDATIIYTCSTCFSEELLKSLAEVFDRCPNLRYIISMKAISSKLPFDSIIDVDCTWDKSRCHIYIRPPIAA